MFLSAQELLDLSFELGHKIAESGFRPSCLIGVWRGGAPVGIAVHEYLSLRGIHPVHFPVKTQRYGPDGDTLPQTRIWGLSAWDDEIDKAESLLIVDDVWDKGVTICELVEKLKNGHEDL